MRKIILLILLVFTVNRAFSQAYSGYSNEKLKIKSEFLQDSISLNLHLPETFGSSAASVKYPVTIIFDSQHERTYPQIISSIDLLTNESQMPETIIIGIPFNRRQRYYNTSGQKKAGDSLSGIERTEKFLFEELIPKLKREFKADNYLTLIGHSRTAFLVNYLVFSQSEKINLAIALSGFYDNEPLSAESFKSHISDASNFPVKCKYYFSAGSTLEEKTYLLKCKEMADYISNNKMPKNFIAHFSETKNANHITNFWVSTPTILADHYAAYNSILDNWLYVHLEKDSIENPIEKFKSDLKRAGDELGFKVNPNLTHIFSLASSFRFQKNDYQTAIDFLKLGQKYYPNYTDFDLELIECYKQLNNLKMSEHHKAEYRKKVAERKDISRLEKEELLNVLE